MIKRGEVPEPTEDTYISMIAKVILFKECDKLVAKQNFGGYKAQIDYYTIALLAEFFQIMYQTSRFGKCKQYLRNCHLL